ncbi:MAG TPA: low molecular weight protein arginine phosphatase [Gemmatimonadales bacterium]|nr:low molecular weight protein arginine phosphatase [Gemmatimonadales bacterium]
MHILLVCTGNTCRSPVAEALLRAALSTRSSLSVASAGTGAWEGAPVSEGAYLVGLEHGLDLSGHRARMLTRDLVAAADLVLTMSRHHAARVADLGGGDRVHLLGEFAGRAGPEGEVSDPFGGDLDDYRRTYAELEELAGEVAARLTAEHSGDQR